MTDDDKALVQRLRSGRWLGETTCGPAADRIEAQAAEIDIAQKVILEQLQARKEQADEIERLRQILVDAVEIINDQMPGEFPEWEIYAKSALGEAE